VQQRRERENRQINERLRTLIAAYKTLGGSFTGKLTVDPFHLADWKREAVTSDQAAETSLARAQLGSDRSRRIRDAVEASLSDIILLGTEEQVRLAAAAAAELAAGRPVSTAALVVCLRDFIREVLDLQPVPPELPIPTQGPSRSLQAKGAKEGERGEGKQGGGGGAGGGGGMGGAGGGGMTTGFNEEGDTEHHE
jgi:uncharacterized membrane protein YgcG